MLVRSLLLSLIASLGLSNASQDPAHGYSGPQQRILVARSSYASKCVGKERWAVKTGIDDDVGNVDMSHPTDATVSDLTHKTEPAHKPKTSRVSPVETTVFQVSATLTQYAMENDRDYHLVLKSGRTTMIVEIPDPACVKEGSPFKTKIAKARADFEARFSPTSTFQQTSTPVTVTGVGFFDMKHGKPQVGVARNNIELHPVLDIKFDAP